MKQRLRTGLAWVTQNWARPGTIVPLILAFAMPALFLSAGFRFEQAVEDTVTRQILDDLPDSSLGLNVVTNGVLVRDRLDTVDALVTQRLGAIAELSAPTRMTYSARGTASVIGSPTEAPTPIRASPRFFSRPGATESLELIEHDTAIRGVLVSQDFASRGGLAVGSLIDVEVGTSGATVQVAGIYRDLWPERPPYWEDVPQHLVPRWDSFFQMVSAEALVINEAALADLGVDVLVRWDAPASDRPRTLKELERSTAAIGRLEDDLVRDPELLEGLASFAGLAAPAPQVTSELPNALDEVTAALRSVERPLASTQAAGVTLGMVIVAASSFFLAIQRQRVWRVLSSAGDGPLRLIGLAVAEVFVPALVGTVLGVATGVIAVSWLVPGVPIGLDAIDPTLVGASTGAAIVVAAAVTTAVALRTTGPSKKPAWLTPTSLLLAVTGFAIAAWMQLGSTDARTSISAVVVVAPIAIFGGVAGIAMTLLRTLVSWLGRHLTRAPLPVRLGLRRIARTSLAASALAGALAVASGLSTYAIVTAHTRLDSVDAKSATVVGAESTGLTLDRAGLDTLNDVSIVRTSRTELTPANRRVQVIAIDHETFADVAAWPRAFGDLDASQVVAQLERSAGDDIPAVWVSSRSPGGAGAFGTGETFPFRVVGRVESAPFVSGSSPVLVIRADALDSLARERFDASFERNFGREPDQAAVDANYVSPLASYRHRLISNLRARDLEQLTMANDIALRDVIDRRDIRDRPSERAAQSAFDYVVFVGVGCLAAALAATGLYARERRRGRALADRVARSLGLTRRTTVIASVIEFLLLAVVAIVPAAVAALAVAARVAPTFDTMADVPPTVHMSVPMVDTLLVNAGAIIAAVVVGVLVGYERLTSGVTDE